MSHSAKPESPQRRRAEQLGELEEIEVEIEKLVSGGLGLARYEGVPVLVGDAAPGDRLRVRLVERRPDYGRAEIVEILRPGPDRRTPPCPHFGFFALCDRQQFGEPRLLLNSRVCR